MPLRQSSFSTVPPLTRIRASESHTGPATPPPPLPPPPVVPVDPVAPPPPQPATTASVAESGSASRVKKESERMARTLPRDGRCGDFRADALTCDTPRHIDA